MTQVRMDISAIVMPRDDLAKDLLLSTWPKNVIKTVTKDNSIVFANNANTVEAVEGASLPPVRMNRPYRG